MCYYGLMMKYAEELKIGQMQVSAADFLESYNKNIPKGFPLASLALLTKFKEANAKLFAKGDLWSLDQHRKKVIDWLSRKGNIS